MTDNTRSRSARLVKRGDIVRYTPPGADEPFEDVVRDVDIILHLASGMDHVVPASSDVVLADDSEITDKLRAEIEGMQSEG